MDHQDFKVVVLRKKESPKKENNEPKIEEKKDNGDIIKPKTFPKEFGKKLSALRTEKKMNRKELALKLNLRESVVSDIETGKHLYDGGIVHKLKKIFPTL